MWWSRTPPRCRSGSVGHADHPRVGSFHAANTAGNVFAFGLAVGESAQARRRAATSLPQLACERRCRYPPCAHSLYPSLVRAARQRRQRCWLTCSQCRTWYDPAAKRRNSPARPMPPMPPDGRCAACAGDRASAVGGARAATRDDARPQAARGRRRCAPRAAGMQFMC